MTDISNEVITQAQSGNAQALDALVRGIQDNVHRLARRMLVDPELAQDATQEILIRVVTKLSTYRGQAAFRTWVYRVATNYLLTARKARAAELGLSFQAFSDDLLNGLVDDVQAAPETHVLLNELRVNCTMAMLLCLDPDHRAAYVLGEVLEMEHREASDILDIPPATYRKRLSRARGRVESFTRSTCGLANDAAACSCPRRLPAAIASGRVPPEPMLTDAPDYAAVRDQARRMQADLVTAKLQRATGTLPAPEGLAGQVLNIVIPAG